MKNFHKHLKKLEKVERHKYHPLIHKIHKKYNISRKTLFYVKEYGSKANVSRVIIKESLKILIFASIISSLGGVGLEKLKTIFISVAPLVILLPVLNDMIGDYGTIISSRLATMLHQSKVKNNPFKNKEVKLLLKQITIISISTAIISAISALLISHFAGFDSSSKIAYKIFLISILDTILLVSLLFFVTLAAGVYFYKKKEDPNNFLIPIATSIADFGNMIILAILVLIFF